MENKQYGLTEKVCVHHNREVMPVSFKSGKLFELGERQVKQNPELSLEIGKRRDYRKGKYNRNVILSNQVE